MREVLLAAITSLSLVGCVGDLSTGGTTGGNDDDDGDTTDPGQNPNPNGVAKKQFEETVYPIISQDWLTSMSGCAGAGCHELGNTPTATQFVAPTVDEGWITITGFTAVVGSFTPTTAGILTKLDLPHNARVYTDAEKQAIIDWLAVEADERANPTGGGGGDPMEPAAESPAQATSRLMNAWSSCLTLADFQAANMGTEWNQMTAGGQACNACHTTGLYGFIVSPIIEGESPPGFYTTLATKKEYMGMWFTPDLTVTGADGKRGKMVINEQAFIGVSQGKAPHATHPTFNALNNDGMDALREWYELTMQKIEASATGNCGETQLNPPA